MVFFSLPEHAVMSVVRADVRDVQYVRPSTFCVHSRGQSFDLINLKLCQNVNLNERAQFYPKLIKPRQNVNLHKI